MMPCPCQFLHVEPWSSFAFYKRHIVDPVKEGDQAGRAALHNMLSRIMIRRTKETKDSNGQPLVQMPDKVRPLTVVVTPWLLVMEAAR